jgi:Uma2 family endonuclease
MPLALDLNKHYTYADYLTWDDGERYELIHGVPYRMVFDDPVAMTPAPSVVHQAISAKLFLRIATFFEGKQCQAYSAPIDVCLSIDTGDDTVVQPDIIVVCDKEKIGDKAINGAPDLVVEILSKSNSLSEMNRKFNIYLQSGVKEYWVVNPFEQSIQLFMLQEGRFATYALGDTMESPSLSGLSIALDQVFNT